MWRDIEEEELEGEEEEGNPLAGLGRAPRPQDVVVEEGRVLGEGAFSTVLLARDARSGRRLALKVCEKRLLVRAGAAESARREKAALAALEASASAPASAPPLFVRLWGTFQDARNLYFALSLAPRGDLQRLVARCGRLRAAPLRFYAAQMVRALEHLHALAIVHRDLKPANVLLDRTLHVKIADFGSAKILSKEEPRTPPDIDIVSDEHEEEAEEEEEEEEEERERWRRGRRRRWSFVGTAQYLAPEVLRGRRVSHATDLWALGCCLYEMAVGAPPFADAGEYGTFRKILAQAYSFPREEDREVEVEVEAAVRALLVGNPAARLGALDAAPYASLRAHPLLLREDLDRVHLRPAPKELLDTTTDAAD